MAGVSNTTTVDMRNVFRGICAKRMKDNPHIVQVDESVACRSKLVPHWMVLAQPDWPKIVLSVWTLMLERLLNIL